MAISSIRCGELAGALAALATAAAVHGQARVIYVDASNTGTQSGASWATAYRDLQDALYAASTDIRRFLGIEIRISQGVYTPDRGTLNPSMSFALNSAVNVTLKGGFAGLAGADHDARDPGRFVSVLSGDLNRDDGANFANYEDNTRTILTAFNSSQQATLDGLEISGGNADALTTNYPASQGVITTVPSGGSVGRLLIRNCSIVRNRAVVGPVLQLTESEVIGSRISGNRTQNTTMVQARQCSFTACEMRDNHVVATAPNSFINMIRINPGSTPATTLFRRCLIADNTSGGYGVLTCVDYRITLSLLGCTIVGNSAPNSPAIMVSDGHLLVRDSIIARNVQNSLPSQYVQVYCANTAWLDSNATVLVDNGLAGMAIGAGPSVAPLAGDPIFASPGAPGYDYHLRPGSPAIDRADSSLLSPDFSDLDGELPFDVASTPNLGSGPYAYVDLGCYEFQGALCPADFNHSGSLSVDDIFDFLNGWLGGLASADFDGGGLSVQDIFAFINAWMAGC